MKITLISPYPDITAIGIRTISAHLKRTGHQTRLIFLPDPFVNKAAANGNRYDDRVLDGLIPLCGDADIIGVTLMTDFFYGAVQITGKIKGKLDKPVIWGGVHPTVSPEECLNYADIVCVGEGEEVLEELLGRMQRKESYEDTKNLWLKKNGTIIRNPVRCLNTNLDAYPMPDYSFGEQYLLFDNKIQKMTHKLLELTFRQSPVSEFISPCGYQTMTSRGCPHKCTYCANDSLKNLYEEHGYLRWRSTEHVINELVWVKQNMPYVGHICFSDDSFFARKAEEIKNFCIQYKEKVGLPFFALASPTTLTEEKMSFLMDAGLGCLQMGIQTGSGRMQELYNRKPMNNERTLKAINIINKYKDRLYPPHYDFILDSPYETVEDKLESLRFISRIPKPFELQTFSMMLYPGTKLYEMAKRDGLIKDEKQEIYNRSYVTRKANYINLLFRLASGGKFPGWLLRVFISAPAVWVFNSRLLGPFFENFDSFLKRVYHLIKRT